MLVLLGLCVFAGSLPSLNALCMPFTYGSWHEWGPCSNTCGGGTRTRSQYSCTLNNERRDTGSCNQFCYNGGTYSGGCHCPQWRRGRCCENCQHITIDHCKSGRQECGGSPDNVRCTECDHIYTPAGWGQGCTRKPCNDENGGCDQRCFPVQGVPTCSCRQGYELHSNLYTCTDIDECSTGEATCGQICTNLPGSYQCSCRQGFTLDSDGKTCSDIDECLNETYCQQQCINHPGNFSCDCDKGYELYADGRSCIEIDECVVDNGGCDQICVNEPGSYHCACGKGYTLSTDHHLCADIDECTEHTAKCNQHCTNTLGSYRCHCGAGFSLSTDGVTCSDIDDCIGVTCHNGGTCINHVLAYTCSCTKGFSGSHCEVDINECDRLGNGGCEDQCINTVGSYFCSCFENRTLDIDRHSCTGGNDKHAISVFEQESIFRKLLPRGCHTLLLSKCNEVERVELSLSSTSPWFSLTNESSVTYTFGIVFAEINDLSLPISITGLTVERANSDFKLLTGSVQYDYSDGTKLVEQATGHCWSFDLTPRHVHDFLISNSFFNTFFENLDKTLPQWLRFSDKGSELFELSGLNSELIRGSDLEKTTCRGAPVHSARLYTMLRFNHDVAMSIYGHEFTLPKSLSGREYCILIDICKDLGGTVFLLLPPESRDILDTVPIFSNLKEKYKFVIRPRGIGLSVKRSINAQRLGDAVEVWNGDNTFSYPLTSKANFWLGGDAEMNHGYLHLTGGADLYLSVPSPLQLLQGLFQEEWTIHLAANVNSSLRLPFHFGGRIHYLDFGHVAFEGYGSVGGHELRTSCGNDANPSGFFVSLFAKLNPFINVPILKRFGFNLEAKAYVFVATDPSNNSVSSVAADLTDDLFDLQKIVTNLSTITATTSQTFKNILSTESNALLSDIGIASNNLEKRVIDLHASIQETDSNDIMNYVSGVWETVETQIKGKVEQFIDSVEFNSVNGTGQLAVILNHELSILKASATQMANIMIDKVFALARDLNGFGIKFQGELDIIGIKIIGAEIELVYSVDRLGECSKYARMYDVMKGEKAIRMRIALSTKLVQIARFIRLDVGSVSIFAISIDNPAHFLLQSEGLVSLFGLSASSIITISPHRVNYRLEGRIWDVFYAEIECSAYHNEDWSSLTVDVRGQLLAKASDGSSFGDSYLDGLRRAFQKISDGASERISSAQNTLSNAQVSLTKAQNWLESKKDVIRNANRYFDIAVSAMENAKQKLEDAKGPFQRAIESLNAAQRNVDNLCQIRSCRQFCVPGLSCSICWTKVWFVKIPYPCCHFTNCMISFPDPICVALNLGCRAIRGIAYVALEAAKLFVRIPMLALDAAKLAVSAAQIVVDKSRIVLDVGLAAVDIAKIGLEAAKCIIEEAKIALEAVKLLLKGAVKVLNFVIKEGVQKIIDVRNCKFHVQVGSRDLPVFEVVCQVNPFMLGWVDIAVRINFRDSERSLWNAAKGSVDGMVEASYKTESLRKKRDIKAATLGKLHKVIRNSRDLDLEKDNIDIDLDELINATLFTPGLKNSFSFTDYGNRVDVFREKCETYMNALTFLARINEVLQEMAVETAGILDHLGNMSDELNSFDMGSLHEHLSLESSGVNVTVAFQDYNISRNEMDAAIAKAKADLSNDTLMSEIQNVIQFSKEHVKSQQENIDNVQIVALWMTAMNNISRSYFDNDTCASFVDCTHYSITKLYDLHDAEHFENVTLCVDAISAWEEIFLNLTANTSHTVQTIRDFSIELQIQTNILNDSNVFCSTAPELISQPTNTTVRTGTKVRLVCEMTGKPMPQIWWLKNGVLMENGTGRILVIENASESDSSMYSCMAGNVVANLTSEEAYVSVLDDYVPPFEGEDVHIDTKESVILASVMGSCSILVVVGAVLIAWRRYKRYQFKKGTQMGSMASLNIIKPHSSKKAFDPSRIRVREATEHL